MRSGFTLKRSANQGFTLIELILVTAIVLGLGVFAFSFYARFLTQNGVSNAADQLVQSLRKAQSYAMMSRKSNSSGWGVKYLAPTPIITFYQGNTYATRNQGLDEKYTVGPSINISPNFEINYSRMSGLPVPTPPPASPVTITISGRGTSEAISVNSQGVVSR